MKQRFLPMCAIASSLQRFSIGCRGRASARPPAGLKTGRYTHVENALIWKDLSIVILSVR